MRKFGRDDVGYPRKMELVVVWGLGCRLYIDGLVVVGSKHPFTYIFKMETSNIVDQQANTSDDFEQLHVGTEKNNLSKTLDDKLERYLETLDEYEKAMKDVSKLLASVCIYRCHKGILYSLMVGLHILGRSKFPQPLFSNPLWPRLLRRTYASHS